MARPEKKPEPCPNAGHQWRVDLRLCDRCGWSVEDLFELNLPTKPTSE